MHIERRHKILAAKVGGALTAATLTIAPTLVSFDNTQRIIGSFMGNKVECAGNTEPLNREYEYDAIVVPGGGAVLTTEGIYIPTTWAQLRLDAAAIAYSQRKAPRIILLDGKASPPDKEGSTISFLNNQVRTITGADIPEGTVIQENKSINTATNMRELKKIVEAENIRKVIIITNDYHEKRATLFACEYGVPSASQTAESIIKEHDPSRTEEIHRLYHTPEAGNNETKEALEVVLQLWDPKGKIPTLLKKLSFELND